MRDTRDFGDRLKGSDLVVGVHHRNKNCARCQCASDVIRIDPAEAINQKVGYRRSQPFKKTARFENRWVFDLSSDDVDAASTAGEKHTLQRVIIGLTAPTGEYDLV